MWATGFGGCLCNYMGYTSISEFPMFTRMILFIVYTSTVAPFVFMFQTLQKLNTLRTTTDISAYEGSPYWDDTKAIIERKSEKDINGDSKAKIERKATCSEHSEYVPSEHTTIENITHRLLCLLIVFFPFITTMIYYGVIEKVWNYHPHIDFENITKSPFLN